MTSRKCPACGTEWHSADTFTTWTCQKCGCGIPNEDSPYNENNENNEQGGRKINVYPNSNTRMPNSPLPKA